MELHSMDTLSSCPNLHSLCLSRNPLCKLPNYRAVISSLIPSLKNLDHKPLERVGSSKQCNGMILEAAATMQLYQEELEDEQRLEMMLFEDTPEIVPTQGSVSGGGSARPLTSSGRALAVTAAPKASDENGSELTYGMNNTVLAGNMAHALRLRRTGGTPKASSEARKSVRGGFRPADRTVADNGSIMQALHGSAAPDESSTNKIVYMEGDITSLMLKDVEGDWEYEPPSGPSTSMSHPNPSLKSPQRVLQSQIDTARPETLSRSNSLHAKAPASRPSSVDAPWPLLRDSFSKGDGNSSGIPTPRINSARSTDNSSRPSSSCAARKPEGAVDVAMFRVVADRPTTAAEVLRKHAESKPSHCTPLDSMAPDNAPTLLSLYDNPSRRKVVSTSQSQQRTVEGGVLVSNPPSIGGSSSHSTPRTTVYASSDDEDEDEEDEEVPRSSHAYRHSLMTKAAATKHKAGGRTGSTARGIAAAISPDNSPLKTSIETRSAKKRVTMFDEEEDVSGLPRSVSAMVRLLLTPALLSLAHAVLIGRVVSWV